MGALVTGVQACALPISTYGRWMWECRRSVGGVARPTADRCDGWAKRTPGSLPAGPHPVQCGSAANTPVLLAHWIVPAPSPAMKKTSYPRQDIRVLLLEGVSQTAVDTFRDRKSTRLNSSH